MPHFYSPGVKIVVPRSGPGSLASGPKRSPGGEEPMAPTISQTAPLQLYADVHDACCEPEAPPEMLDEIRELRRLRNAVILAHNYQVPAIQDVADYVGDSLGLAQAAARTDASVIVMCGVYFMAETAKILCPDRTVLIPDVNAGCSLADSITVDDLRRWKARYPGAV